MATGVIRSPETFVARNQAVYSRDGTTHFAASRCTWTGHIKQMPKGTLITCLWCMRDWP